MKQLRWKDFSLVSKIVIEVGMIAVLLFAMAAVKAYLEALDQA